MGGRAPLDLTFESHGARFVVRCADEGLYEAARRAIPYGGVEGICGAPDVTYTLTGKVGKGPPRYAAVCGGRQISNGRDIDKVVARLASDVEFQVAVHARTHLFVHAGVVVFEGRAVVIPGRSFSGKSTLVAALASAGLRYFSDEYALFDDEGLVHPFPRPLGIRQTGKRSVPTDVANLGGRRGEGPLALGMVILTSYDPDARWSPEPLTTAEAMFGLIDNTVTVRARPRQTMDTLARAITGADGFGGPRGEALEVTQWLVERLGSPR